MNLRVSKHLSIIFSGFLCVAAIGLVYYLYAPKDKDSSLAEDKSSIEHRLAEQLNKMDRVAKKAARSDYLFKLMRDPETNKIPDNIRNRELSFAKTLPTIHQLQHQIKTKNPSFKAADYVWQQAGPFDLGGRTRALAVDQRNPDVVLAGGVSGGMWKSTNGGATWNLQTPDLANLSVTSVAQDPTSPDTWYYASGEVLGNSASANNSAPYYGHGIYKSEDNGDTWRLLQDATSISQGLVNIYNTVSRIVVSPTTGTVFISSEGFGIFRSTDGESFTGPVEGAAGEQLFTDVAVASDGTIAATISEASFNDQVSESPTNNHNPGVFISNNDGEEGSWIEITPDTYPETHRRSVLTFAPSNPDVLYILTLKGANDTDNQGVSFHKIEMDWNEGTFSAEDRSANLPDFRPENDAGYMELQGGYNMEVAVKPDNENYVFVGGTNLFRSDDGFENPPSNGYDGTDESQKDEYWIGGYNHNNDNPYALYENQHPDQHKVVFPQPNVNPDIVWSGHDGGLSHTTDVTAAEVSWEDRDNGYVTSQFYSSALPPTPGDNRLVGGTQDNGTAFFELSQQNNSSTDDLSTGDGGYSYFTDNYIFVSSQYGRVIRWSNEFDALSYVSPQIDDERLQFIHPYVVDPNDENIMYYAQENHIWRNTSMDEISNSSNSSGTTVGWEELTNVTTDNREISALAVSRTPANILYMAGSSVNQPPVIRRLENAHTATDGAVDIPLPNSSDLAGAYVKQLAVNPVNANEVIAVLSNYNIVGLYHSLDGGENWTAIEGNLQGNEQNPGPSLRSAAMVPSEGGTVYLLGTSTGLYSTQLLEGDNTQWGQEALDIIGNAVTDYVDIRIADGNVAAGTHGRGMLYGEFQGSTNVPLITANPPNGMAGDQITISASNFEFSSVASENEVIFGDAQAEIIDATSSQLTVIVPRGAIPRDAENNTITLSASNDNDETAVTSFRILPPNNFAISQNFPNPFNSTTNIPFDIPDNSRVSLIIYNINGQKIREPLRQTPFNAGTYNQEIDMSGLASGIYIYRVIAETQGEETFMDSQQLTFIK